MYKIILTIIIFVLHITIATAKGSAIAGKEKIILCIGCHEMDGNSSNPAYPRLAGQTARYLEKQLIDFKQGVRKEEHMTSMVETIDAQDIPDIAAYFASQKKKTASVQQGENKTGKMIYFTGIAAKSIPACNSCHIKSNLINNNSLFPVLAGQHEEYISRNLKAFRSQLRQNDTGRMMRDIASKLSDEEIEAVAAFIAGMKLEGYPAN